MEVTNRYYGMQYKSISVSECVCVCVCVHVYSVRVCGFVQCVCARKL